MVVVDNTTLEVVNLTAAVEEDTTIHRVAEAAVAVGIDPGRDFLTT